MTDRPTFPDAVGVTLGPRLAAGLLDLVLVVLAMVGLVALGNVLAPLDGALRLVATLMPLLYFVILEGYYDTTPGKRLLRLRVVNLDGSSPGLLTALMRGLTRVPEALIVVPYVAFILSSARHQRLGDMITDTIVVRREKVPSRGPEA